MRWSLSSLCGALAVSSCLVSIDDVEPASGTTGGGAGQDGSAASGGSAGGAGTGGTAGAGGSTGGAGGTTADGSAGADAVAPDGSAGSSGGSPSCVLPFQDDFDDGLAQTFWKVTMPAAAKVTEAEGKLNVEFATTITTGFFAGYTLSQVLDLSECSVLVRVDEAPPNDTSVAATFSVFFSSTDYAEIIKTGAKIHFQYFTSGNQEYLASLDYVPDTHRWWRFRHTGGKLSFETSSNGSSWDSRATAALPSMLTGVRIGGSAFKPETEVTASVKLDDFGLPP